MARYRKIEMEPSMIDYVIADMAGSSRMLSNLKGAERISVC